VQRATICAAARATVGALVLAAVVTVADPATSDALPDGRVYEQVSPVDKNAGDIVPSATRVRSGSTGDRVAFASMAAFAGTNGISISSDYVAVRDHDNSGSWRTHGIEPVQDATGYFGIGQGPSYDVLSHDLIRGIFRTRSPLTDAPNVAGSLNLYSVGNLANGGPLSYTLLTDSVEPQPVSSGFTGFVPPAIVGTSSDFSHVFFESQRRLTADAPPCASSLPDCPPLLYGWVNGNLRIMGILPESDGGGVAAISEAGQGAHNGFPLDRANSSDGSRIVFTVPQSSSDRGGDLYLRDDKGTLDGVDDGTVKLNTSESAVSLAGPATFWAASADFSEIFFTSGDQLYRYKLDASDDHHLTLLSVDNEPADGSGGAVDGVVGVSDTGDYVYFVTTSNQLVAGGPTGPTGGPVGGKRMFVWHNGTVRQVAALNLGTETEGILGIGAVSTARLTPDGTHLIFVTEGTDELLTLYGHPAYDHGDSCPSNTFLQCAEIYVYDATGRNGDGDLQCASCDPTGARASSDATFGGSQAGIGQSGSTGYINHPLSTDGRFVFFNTNARLQPNDKNDLLDAYEYDTTSRELHLISTGTSNDLSTFLDASPDGHDVFFATRDPLRSSDNDQNRDLYDARIGGTVDEGSGESPICRDEDCRPAAHPSGSVSPWASEAVAGPGDRLEGSNPPAVFGIKPISSRQRRTLVRRGVVTITIQSARPGLITLKVRLQVAHWSRILAVRRWRTNRGTTVHAKVRLPRRAQLGLDDKKRANMTIRVTHSQAPLARVIRIPLRVHGGKG
jgi:hypothetical protein